MSTETKNATTPVPADDVEDLLDPNELAESLTGFDQIAIRTRFNERFDQISEDSLMLMRVLYFVHVRRQGVNDRDAHKQVMDMPLGAFKEKFISHTDDDGDTGDESAAAERDRDFAEFVIATGLSYTVDQYMTLTLSQRGAVLTASNQHNRR